LVANFFARRWKNQEKRASGFQKTISWYQLMPKPTRLMQFYDKNFYPKLVLFFTSIEKITPNVVTIKLLPTMKTDHGYMVDAIKTVIVF
jgi:hypothetical protein